MVLVVVIVAAKNVEAVEVVDNHFLREFLSLAPFLLLLLLLLLLILIILRLSQPIIYPSPKPLVTIGMYTTCGESMESSSSHLTTTTISTTTSVIFLKKTSSLALLVKAPPLNPS